MSSSQLYDKNINSSLRPRNKRLIPFEGGDGTVQHSVDLASTPGTVSSSSKAHGVSNIESRSISPSSAVFESRMSNRTKGQSSQPQTTGGSRRWGLTVPIPTSASALFSPKYWEDSWSSIQGVANIFLRSDTQDPPRSARSPRSGGARQGSRIRGSVEDEWGPTIIVESQLTAGSQEDRLAQIQARKRQALLTANGHHAPDVRGKYKRKISVDETETTVSECSEDALVYVHHIQPSDTVMGIAIKYGCSEAIVRKSNRLWANDSMQLRRLAYIPVDACAIRGLKIIAPMRATLPTLPNETKDSSSRIIGAEVDWTIPDTPKALYHPSSMPSPSISATTTSIDGTPFHVHESWVQLSGFTATTEIARLSRRTLGFFPPARRKSISYHDATPSSANSLALSVSSSPPHHSSSAISQALLSPENSQRGRPRTVSSAITPNNIASALRGPGGVGTLGAEARTPGPAQDKLNTFFIAHFPSAAIPIISPSSGTLSHRPSFDSIRSGFGTPNGTGSFEQMGGRVETWVRKLAAKGIKELNSGKSGGIGSRRGSTGQLINTEVQGEGDLIELMDSIDLMGIGEGQDQSTGKGKGRAQEPSTTSISNPSHDSEALHERFPIGGRVFESVKR